MTHIGPGITLVLLLGTLGLIPRVRHLGRGAKLLTPLALLGLFLWSFMPAAMLFSWTLERWYPWGVPTGDAGAIVVLTGGIEESGPSRPEALSAESTYRRAMYAAWLYKNWKALPVLVSGGSISTRQEDPAIGELARAVLLGQGLPAEMLWLEGNSFSTYGNAVNSVRMLRARGITRVALVTDSVHMLRSDLVFRKQGIDVVPAPCCAVSAGQIDRVQTLVPTYRAIEANEAALHEWMGLIWYWMSGRI